LHSNPDHESHRRSSCQFRPELTDRSRQRVNEDVIRCKMSWTFW